MRQTPLTHDVFGCVMLNQFTEILLRMLALTFIGTVVFFSCNVFVYQYQGNVGLIK